MILKKAKENLDNNSLISCCVISLPRSVSLAIEKKSLQFEIMNKEAFSLSILLAKIQTCRALRQREIKYEEIDLSCFQGSMKQLGSQDNLLRKAIDNPAPFEFDQFKHPSKGRNNPC